jgi:cyclopropane fatty-acyl-phospholipid synthase-like methyltransferase
MDKRFGGPQPSTMPGTDGVSDPHEIVREGYDAIADRYAAWAASFESPAMRWVERLLTELPEGSDVLELGCGGGGPATLAMAARHRLVGVDISVEQITRAHAKVPNAEFVQADVTKLELDATYDAVVSLFMLGHVHRTAQEPLLRKIHTWLRPGGWFLGTMGTADADDVVEEDWLGAPMFFASFDERTNTQLLERAGFRIEDARVVPFEEPGHGLVRFMWVLARRPG